MSTYWPLGIILVGLMVVVYTLGFMMLIEYGIPLFFGWLKRRGERREARRNAATKR